MATRRYPRPPITEAILDIRVEALTQADRLAALAKAEHTNYPSVEPVTHSQVHVELGPIVRVDGTTTDYGHVAWSADRRQAYQARQNGFTFSRLAPYEHFPPFRAEAERLWNRYRETAGPGRLVRLGVRYVNRLDLPLPVADLKDYLRTGPELSPDLPQGLVHFFFQAAVQTTLPGVLLTITETPIPPPHPGVGSVVLDLDLSCAVDVPQEEQAIWEFFESLRPLKNQAFEACITDKARELFQ